MAGGGTAAGQDTHSPALPPPAALLSSLNSTQTFVYIRSTTAKQKQFYFLHYSLTYATIV